MRKESIFFPMFPTKSREVKLKRKFKRSKDKLLTLNLDTMTPAN